MTNSQTAVEGYAILEIMGHRRLAGWLSEQEIAGHGFIRIDVPTDDGTLATQFYSPQSVYAITPCTEEIAREIAKSAPKPVQRWDLRGLLPAETPRQPAYDQMLDVEASDEHFNDDDDQPEDDDEPPF